MFAMAKSTPHKISKNTITNVVKEPMVGYQAMPLMPPMVQIADFTYNKFEAIASTVPFTQKEWANILHLSDRTLQRYAQSNTAFEGLYVDRILHIQQLLELGLKTFVSADAFYAWLKKDKNVMGQLINFQSLYSTQGIQETINQVGRILYNVYS